MFLLILESFRIKFNFLYEINKYIIIHIYFLIFIKAIGRDKGPTLEKNICRCFLQWNWNFIEPEIPSLEGNSKIIAINEILEKVQNNQS